MNTHTTPPPCPPSTAPNPPPQGHRERRGTIVPGAVIASTLETLNLLDEFFRLHASTATHAELRQFAGRQGWHPIHGAEVLIESIGLDARGLTRARASTVGPGGAAI